MRRIAADRGLGDAVEAQWGARAWATAVYRGAGKIVRGVGRRRLAGGWPKGGWGDLEKKSKTDHFSANRVRRFCV